MMNLKFHTHTRSLYRETLNNAIRRNNAATPCRMNRFLKNQYSQSYLPDIYPKKLDKNIIVKKYSIAEFLVGLKMISRFFNYM